jgi:hypothetical protein
MVIILVSISILVSTTQIINAYISNYSFLGSDIFSKSRESLISPVTNDSKNVTNRSSLLNITQTLNTSNITGLNSNFTNNSEIFNTTIPEQVSPKALNGSTPAKI